MKEIVKRGLGRISIDAVLGRAAGLKNGARKPHTINPTVRPTSVSMESQPYA